MKILLLAAALFSALSAAPASPGEKTDLQELVQRQTDQVLTYHMIGEAGPDHDKTFQAEVQLNGQPVGTGTGHSKKEAEQAAARAALEALEEA